jgi:hypothetical protein
MHSSRAAGCGSGPEDHYEVAAVAALKSIKVQNLPGCRMFLLFTMYTFKVSLFITKCTYDLKQVQIVTLIPGPLSESKVEGVPFLYL